MIEVFDHTNLPAVPNIAYYETREILNSPTAKIQASEYIRRNWSNYGFAGPGRYVLMSDNIDELLDVIHMTKVTVSIPTLKQKDKIFIHESSEFPSLLLGRLDVGLKRTTQPDKADYIVVEPKLSEHKEARDIYLYALKPNTKDTVIAISTTKSWNSSENDVKKDLMSLQANFKLKINVDLKYAISVAKKDYDLYDQTQKSSNFIATSTLVSYIYSQLPALSDSEYENLVSMITARDHESVVAGYNLLQYVNIADRIPELAIALTKNSNIELLNTAAAKYIYYVLGTDASTIRNYQGGSFQYKLGFRINMVKNPLVSNSVRDRVIKALREDLLTEILDKYSEQLKTLEVDINFTVNESSVDENGETETSDREMETE